MTRLNSGAASMIGTGEDHRTVLTNRVDTALSRVLRPEVRLASEPSDVTAPTPLMAAQAAVSGLGRGQCRA